MRIVIALLAVVLVFANGCETTPKLTPAAVQPAYREWAAGLVITFANLPSEETRELLIAAGASELLSVTEAAFVLERYNRFDDSQSKALEAALREGAVLTGKAR